MFQGIHRLCQEGDEAEEMDEGIERGCEEDEEDEEEKPKEKEGKERDSLSDKSQKKEHTLPERRSRRLKSEVSRGRVLFYRACDLEYVELWHAHSHRLMLTAVIFVLLDTLT